VQFILKPFRFFMKVIYPAASGTQPRLFVSWQKNAMAAHYSNSFGVPLSIFNEIFTACCCIFIISLMKNTGLLYP
jgi:hypothetical protein